MGRLTSKIDRLENFVFESREAAAQLKLIDFGLSSRHEKAGLKRMKTLVGTPYYMAPEVIDRSVQYGNVRVCLAELFLRTPTNIPPKLNLVCITNAIYRSATCGVWA